MSRRGIARRSLLVSVLALILVLPPAGAASASHRPQPAPPRPAALPSVSQLLQDTGLAELLNQLLPAPVQPGVGALPGAVVSRVAAS
ncbi:MAG: hypothetical protein M3314_15995, partial [Actinomycetota bacterium]|nr:hypothetical protein [Actinomycetota bacterium]